jgi:hypothetical protein
MVEGSCPPSLEHRLSMLMPTENQDSGEVVHVQARLDERERRSNMLIGLLRRTSIFDELVKRFVQGQSVVQVSTWVYDLKPEGPLKDASYNTIRAYLTALRARVRTEVAEHLEKHQERVVKEEEIIQTIRATPMPAHRPDHFTSLIDQRLRDLSATDILRGAFVLQLERVEEMRQLERTQETLVPRGYKEIEVLVSIAVSIGKIDLGVETLRQKNLRDSTRPPRGTVTPMDLTTQ